MKALLRQWILSALRGLTRRHLKRVQPRIIGVTGSAGKTTTKEIMAAILERRHKIKKSDKNLNTEFGAVYSILGLRPARGLSDWGRVLFRACIASLKTPEPYEKLVLEMGVDKPGDMDEILKVFTPNIMVFLNVKNIHIDKYQFPNRQAIYDEKSKACYAVAPNDFVVVNIDDSFARQLVDKVPANVVSIGTSNDADLRASKVRTDRDGLHFNLEYEDKSIPVHVPGILGECHLSSILAGIAVGFLNGLPWKVIEHALKEFQLPPGRMNPLPGKNDSMIIDSSYNASEDTMLAALDVLSLFSGRKIAALGTMNELGELTESSHRKVGKAAAEKADMLIAVGAHAKLYAEGAHTGGMSASMIHVFDNSQKAGEFLAGALERNDTVLAKGSQNNVRMEHLVKACMKYPDEARKKLVRQEPYWLRSL